MFFHIDLNTNTIVSGPHTLRSEYIGNLTGWCGNPELLDLQSMGIVPLEKPSLTCGQQYAQTVTVYSDKVVQDIEALPLDAHIDVACNVYTNAIQNYLDTAAQACRYDGILSLCTYFDSTDAAFKEEGLAGRAWRDQCWRIGYQILDDVRDGLRTIPTEEELLLELPPVPVVLRMAAAARDGVTLEEDTTYGTENQTLWTTIKSWFGF